MDPSTIRHSLSNSSSSGSTGIDPPPMQAKPGLGSGLIGATLNSRVQQKQQQQQPNISVSRPGVGLSNGSARFCSCCSSGLCVDRSMFIIAAGHQPLRLILFLRNSAAPQRRRQECVRLLFRSNRLHSHSLCRNPRRPHPKRSPTLPRMRRTRSRQTPTMPEAKWPHSPISPRPTSMRQHPV